MKQESNEILEVAPNPSRRDSIAFPFSLIILTLTLPILCTCSRETILLDSVPSIRHFQLQNGPYFLVSLVIEQWNNNFPVERVSYGFNGMSNDNFRNISSTCKIIILICEHNIVKSPQVYKYCIIINSKI